MNPTTRSSQYLTHPYPSFYGCTLRETYQLIAVLAVIQLPIITVCSLLLGHYLGGFVGAFLVGVVVAFLLTRFVFLPRLARWIGRKRAGKPPGALRWQIKWWCHRHLGTAFPLVTRRGVWSTRRHYDV